MARDYTPIVKQSRREGAALAPKAHKVMAKKSGIPGQHGDKRVRGGSLYLSQLREKQKTKRIYGVLEGQFRDYYEKADRMKGITGENMLSLLERRLDNVIFRLGLASSRSQARQLVTHGHFTVNGKKVNIASYSIKLGDVIAVKENKKDNKYFTAIKGLEKSNSIPKWLEFNTETLSGKVIALPTREDIDSQIAEHMIVELYSK